MTEPTTEPAPKPKKRRAASRRKRAAAAPKPTGEFVGLNATDCCDACRATKCVITGIGICAHPFKGGLQAAMQTNEEVVRRYNRAKAFLRDAKITVR